MEEPKFLRCEYQTEPLGIDVAYPRFSWVNTASRRGETQQSYRIVVRDENRIVWDSGRVVSSESAQIAYDGDELESSMRYQWHVIVWGVDGEATTSEDASFETAFLRADEWQASWITMPNPRPFEALTRRVIGDINYHEEHTDGHYWALYFHKSFRVPGAIRRARVHVSGLGYYRLHVNGERVGDRHLDPAQSDYSKLAYYATLDITDHLVAGENGIGIVVGNGRHISPFGYRTPMAIAQVHVDLEDGSRTSVGTDSSWVASHGPIHENGIYLGEVCDQRDAHPGWATAGHESIADAPDHAPAETVKGGPPLRAQAMPPVRAVKALRAVQIHSPEPGVHVFDFGVNTSGVVRLTVQGERGTAVTIRYSELLDEHGGLHLGTNREATASDTYILAGDPVEVYEPSFTYHGFRYAELRGFPGVPNEESLQAVVTHTDVQPTGSFRCSKPLYNRIHEAILRGQVSNLCSVPTDCPQRGERMGWLGDAQLTTDEAMHNFDMATFYTKYLEDIRLSIREDGALSDVTPPYWPLYPADPAWGTAYPTIAWKMYEYYGDTSILRHHYEGIKKYVEFLNANAEEHIVRSGKYGDWCPPACTYPKRTPVALTSTFYYYMDTLTCARIADVLGRRDESATYHERADRIRDAFNREFNDQGRYAVTRMSPIDRHGSQTSQLLPFALGIVPDEDRDRCEEILMREVVERFDYHPDTGIVGMRYLLEVLSALGHPDVAHRIFSQTVYPSLGYMIEQGATTLWERWENLSGVGMNSHNHIMFGSVDTWFYSTLCGIHPEAPGWKSVRVEPWFPADMTHAEASLKTIRGEIAVSWERSDGETKLDVTVPVGTTTRVRLSIDPETEIREGDDVIDSQWAGKNGIDSVDRDADSVAVVVGCGRYVFSWRR